MEGKTVKLSVPIYNRLDELRGKRETFSNTVERLLDMRDVFVQLNSVIQGQKQFREYQVEKLKEPATID